VVPSLYRPHIAKVKLLGLGLPLTCMLSLIIYMPFRYKPHIFWSTAPFSMIFCAGEFKIHALSTQASEKSAWLFSPFGFGLFLAIALICIRLLLLQLSCFFFFFLHHHYASCFVAGCILIVSKMYFYSSKIDLTWPNQPGPCGTLWSIPTTLWIEHSTSSTCTHIHLYPAFPRYYTHALNLSSIHTYAVQPGSCNDTCCKWKVAPGGNSSTLMTVEVDDSRGWSQSRLVTVEVGHTFFRTQIISIRRKK
jgi:hypothetical protein